MNRDERKAWGPLIRTAREALGLTQDDLAEQANTTRRTLGAIERGDTVAQLAVLERLLASLGMSPQQIDGDVETFLSMLGPLLQLLNAEQRAALMPEIARMVATELAGESAKVIRPTFGAGRKRDEMQQVDDDAAWDED